MTSVRNLPANQTAIKRAMTDNDPTEFEIYHVLCTSGA